jgi:hypothetical protein
LSIAGVRVGLDAYKQAYQAGKNNYKSLFGMRKLVHSLFKLVPLTLSICGLVPLNSLALPKKADIRSRAVSVDMET